MTGRTAHCSPAGNEPGVFALTTDEATPAGTSTTGEQRRRWLTRCLKPASPPTTKDQ
jgi:hypothetical protein